MLGGSANFEIQPRNQYLSEIVEKNGTIASVGTDQGVALCGCNTVNNGGRYVKRNRGLKWQPLLPLQAGCLYRPVPTKKTAAWLRSKRVLMSGDSHMRIFFNRFAKFICGKDSAVAAKLTKSWQTFNISHGPCAGARLVYVWDPMGEAVPDVVSWDLVVVTFGHHPASRRWTQASYRARVDDYVSALSERAKVAARAGAEPRIVFMSSPPQVDRQDCFPIKRGDWRTNPRIMAFNDYVRRTVSGTPIAFLDAFSPAAAAASLLLPCVQDKSHFDCAWVQLALTESLMHLLWCAP